MRHQAVGKIPIQLGQITGARNRAASMTARCKRDTRQQFGLAEHRANYDGRMSRGFLEDGIRKPCASAETNGGSLLDETPRSGEGDEATL